MNLEFVTCSKSPARKRVTYFKTLKSREANEHTSS